MKVFNIGYSKTGTKSMSNALTILGYKNYDYDSAAFYLCDDWVRIMNKGGTKEDFYRMYKDVESCTDAPANLFWPEILEAFPDVKLIFTYRDEDAWVRSMCRQFEVFSRAYAFQVLALFSPSARRFYRLLNVVGRLAFGIGDVMLYPKTFSRWSPTVLRKLYREHNSHVLMKAPKDQLLIFDVNEGWEPLCEFLGKPIPDVPFPHKNVAGTVMDEYLEESPVFQIMKKEAVFYLGLYVAILAVVLSFFIFF